MGDVRTLGSDDRCDALVRYHARNKPQATALVFGEIRVSYQELAEAIDSCATGLIRADVQKGDRVATLAQPSIDFVVTFLATVSVGAIWQGLNPRYQMDELSYAIRDARPKIVFTSSSSDGRDYQEEITDIARDVMELERIVPFGRDSMAFAQSADPDALQNRRETLSGDDPAIIVYTSGSTGSPKGALLKHGAIVSMARMQNTVWSADPVIALNFLPINHVGSIVDITIPVFEAGGTLVLMDQFDPNESLDLIERFGVTFWGSIPSVFHLQMAAPRFKETDFSKVQMIVWEGAPMPVDTIRHLKTICPRMATNYGMTETTSAITIAEPTDDEEVLANSVGFPVKGVDVRIADDGNNPVALGETGEIQARSNYNTLGYWRRDDETQAAFTEDGYFKTGDLGVMRPDGRISLVGRIKEMYKSGGYNVYPREIEDVLERQDGVAAAAVVGAKHSVWGEAGVAFILASGPVDAPTLEAAARDSLANFKIPKIFEIVEELPLLPIGKVDKKKLAEKAAALLAAAAD